jgi:vitamin B12 transporter
VVALVCAAPPLRAEQPVVVTVVAERPPNELASEPFVATSRVRRERLAAPAVRVADVLRAEPGVQISEAGGLGAPATASIRGATAAQTPVYLAGVRLNDQVGGVADLSVIPLWLIERVDVYRGNAPFEADELGIGGAISFEPRRPRNDEAAAGVGFGSFGTRSGFGYLALAGERGGVLGGLGVERAENDYGFVDDRGTLFGAGDDQRGKRQNSDSRLRDAWLLARLNAGPRARVELVANDVRREQGVPKLALVPSRSARAELSRSLLAVTARLGLDSSGRTWLSMRSSLLDGATEIHDPARELGTLSQETALAGRRVDQRAALELPLGERFALALAASGSVETARRRDGTEVTSARAGVLGGSARLQAELGHGASAYGLVNWRCRTTEPGERGCLNLEPTGRLGLGLRGAGFGAFANLSRYQREPTLGELYGAGLLVRGNSALLPELGLSLDAGARGRFRRGPVTLRAEASGFVRSASQLVTYARAAQGYVVPINVGRARVSGLELGAGASWLEHVDVSCNATLLDPRDTSPGRRLQNDFLPFMSRLVLAPRLVLSSGELERPTLKRVDLELEAVYLSNRFADAAGLVVVPEQATVNVALMGSWLSGALLTRLRMTNATNAARFDIVGYPLPGRGVFGSLEVRLP